jgi:hypothetical protein
MSSTINENDTIPVKFTTETRSIFLEKRRREVMEQDKRIILRTKQEVKELEWSMLHCNKKERDSLEIRISLR